ncbi:hypothetical protein TTHERM_00052560 (macronuclear) [Tetrahymena thermophila SB210]|uniref:Uncharacterized protein n=1 Tax=Tetrahymena thermophila (strain SB210) TaxID=312017 RepID=Q23CT4_TETTS|nr:hypothetical protein TTHERM_00052560 [Tetrahymena thermophila SB210]EAR94561.2 hypothetical protein TTHERM_00052560 [Tetrahymena thermophila SB210]|eukprot:XP_001014952.2 hypothetical protein TTHERM_00052560 [Tetrahymena thermophila SB210]
MSLDLSNYSQMQQYYIQKKLPEFSSIPQHPKQIKNHQYYNDNTNIWNNRAQTANKNYAFYHQQIDQGKPIIQKMKDKEVVDRLIQEECRKDFIITQKQIDRQRLQSRKQERLALQLESMQDIVNKDGKEINSFLELTTHPSNINSMSINNMVYVKSSAQQNQNPLLGRAPYQWNKLNQTSEKYIKQAINPKIIQKDEEAVHSIANRIQQDNEVDILKQQSFSKIHLQTRQMFLQQHQKNVDFEKKCGLIPQEKPIVIIQSKINKQTLAPLAKKLVSSMSAKQLVVRSPNLNEGYNQEYQIEKVNQQQAFSSEQDLIKENQNQRQNIATPETLREDAQNSARKNVYVQQKSPNKSQPIQIMLNQNTNDIHKNLQYSTLPYQEETENRQNDSIIIQYNDKNNQQTKQQVDQINFGDEKEQIALKNRRKSSMAKESDQSEIHSILKMNVQNMAVNAKSQRAGSFYQEQKQLNNNKNVGNQIDQFATDREFLTSAESHNKKQVNFQANVNQVVQIDNQRETHNNVVFAQKNLDDIQQPANNYKTRRIDELAQPKVEFAPKEFLDRSEYKGLLTTELNNVNVNSDTEFARMMMLNSQIVNSHINNSQRPSTRQSKISRITQTNTNTFSFVRPSTTASGTRSIIYKNPQNISTSNLQANDFYFASSSVPYNSCVNSTSNKIHSTKDIHKMNAESTLLIDQKNELLSEINNFEKKYQFVKENRVGFSKSNLMKFQQKETFMSAKSALGQK